MVSFLQCASFVVQRLLVQLQACSSSISLAACCRPSVIILTWRPPEPPASQNPFAAKAPSKLCAAKHLRQLLFTDVLFLCDHAICLPSQYASCPRPVLQQSARRIGCPIVFLDRQACMTPCCIGEDRPLARDLEEKRFFFSAMLAVLVTYGYVSSFVGLPPNMKTAANQQMVLLHHPVSLAYDTFTHIYLFILKEKKSKPIKGFLTSRDENSRAILQLTWIKHHRLER